MNEPAATIEPLRMSVDVDLSAADAFDLFTNGIARWWPIETHSVSQARATGVVMEPREGGAIYEIRDDGEKCPWGRVLVWEPPTRLVMSWHPSRGPETAQEVEVRFIEADGETTVELEHRDWAKLGDKARETRENYSDGWETVLGLFVEETFED